MQLWYDMAMDGQLWYDLYRQKWPIGFGLEAQLDHTKSSLAVSHRSMHTQQMKSASLSVHT